MQAKMGIRLLRRLGKNQFRVMAAGSLGAEAGGNDPDLGEDEGEEDGGEQQYHSLSTYCVLSTLHA